MPPAVVHAKISNKNIARIYRPEMVKHCDQPAGLAETRSAERFEDLAEIDMNARPETKSLYQIVEEVAKKHNVQPLVIAGMLGLTPCPVEWREGKTQDEVNQAYRSRDGALPQ